MNSKGAETHEMGKADQRLFKILTKSVRSGVSKRYEGTDVVLEFNNKCFRFRASLVAKTIAKGWAEEGSNTLRITRAGLDQFSRQDDSGKAISTSPGRQVQRNKPQYNDAESPLLRLYTRKFPNGRRYLDDSEFAAGERLRTDFEKGQLQPRITASLSTSVGGSGGSGLFGAADISDFALDARNRFQKAVVSIGPELSDIAIDICCFLKGFETVEREKQWPPRSAKLMLKTALAQLSRHYGFSSPENTTGNRITAWGDDNYRPNAM